MKIRITLLLLVLAHTVSAQHVFTDFSSLLNYASGKSISLQSGRIKIEQARKARLAAIAGIPDLTGQATFSYTNNLELPVTLFPSNFADPAASAGEFRAQRLGLQYNSKLEQTAELKLLNLEGWQNLSSAKHNMRVAELDDELNRKTLYEDLATTYFNIVQLQEQLISARENLTASDSLFFITKEKFNQGLLSKQQLNEVQVSYFNATENVVQIGFMIQQQYINLKALADIPETDSLLVSQQEALVPDQTAEVTFNNLNYNLYLAREKTALANYRKNQYSAAPTISLFAAAASNQYNTEARVFDSNWDWYKNSYIGFKLTAPLPFSANNLASTAEARYNYLLAQRNTERARIQDELDYARLRSGYAKAYSQWLNDKAVYALKRETYYKNKSMYALGLLGTDMVLDSFNDMVNSRYTMIQSAITILQERAKIEINNTIK